MSDVHVMISLEGHSELREDFFPAVPRAGEYIAFPSGQAWRVSGVIWHMATGGPQVVVECEKPVGRQAAKREGDQG